MKVKKYKIKTGIIHTESRKYKKAYQKTITHFDNLLQQEDMRLVLNKECDFVN